MKTKLSNFEDMGEELELDTTDYYKSAHYGEVIKFNRYSSGGSKGVFREYYTKKEVKFKTYGSMDNTESETLLIRSLTRRENTGVVLVLDENGYVSVVEEIK